MSINDKRILSKYNLKDLILSKRGDYIMLNKIVANEFGKGYGGKFMDYLTTLADKNKWVLSLTPDTTYGGSSIGRLKKFYKRYGFVPNKGKNTDFKVKDSMIRKPIVETFDFEVDSSEIDLSSFKKKHELAPHIWKPNGDLDSTVRMRLLDIADDF